MSARRRATLTPKGRRVLRCYVMHRDPVPISQVAIAERLSLTRRAVCYHVEWLCKAGLLEPAPDTSKLFRPTEAGKAMARRVKMQPLNGRARRFCRCGRCGNKIELE